MTTALVIVGGAEVLVCISQVVVGLWMWHVVLPARIALAIDQRLAANRAAARAEFLRNAPSYAMRSGRRPIP